jgi:N-acetylmuramic acid 6-phosphate etherase
MKAGTAQKLVLNMISTVAMIRLGYVKGNRMTNVRASNEKLKDRSLRILMAETGLDENSAKAKLQEGTGDLRVAVVMIHANATREEAERALIANNFVIEKAIDHAKGK